MCVFIVYRNSICKKIISSTFKYLYDMFPQKLEWDMSFTYSHFLSGIVEKTFVKYTASYNMWYIYMTNFTILWNYLAMLAFIDSKCNVDWTSLLQCEYIIIIFCHINDVMSCESFKKNRIGDVNVTIHFGRSFIRSGRCCISKYVSILLQMYAFDISLIRCIGWTSVYSKITVCHRKVARYAVRA